VPNAFVFDVNKCTGCGACQLACSIENGLEPDVSWRQVSTFNPRRQPEIPLFHLSLACNHCAQPACMDACPALAYDRDQATGAVLINQDACIGCGYCAWACPFDAPKLDHDRGVMTKCTFCNHRLSEGLTPACAALCPTGALSVADVPEMLLTQPVSGFPQTDLKPSIQIVPPRGPAVPMAATAGAPQPTDSLPESKITLAKEWPLAVFTLLSAILFGLVAAVAMGASAGPDLALGLPLPVSTAAAVFALLAGAGMLLGSAHLGRKTRAWRIVLNVRRSPLSREIVAFSAFVAAALGYLVAAREQPWVGVAAAAMGALALFAVEDVYRFAIRAVPALPHSASVVLTGPFIALALTMTFGPRDRLLVAAFVGTALIKGVLYLMRRRSIESSTDLPGAFRGLRMPLLGLGVAAVVLQGVVATGDSQSAVGLGVVWLGIVCLLVSELIDRCELYTELQIMTPRLQMALDLADRQA
jgi:Fe-S-cluster-containing dehydrogenase component/DMSO reductase anchor subunit